MSGLFRGLYAVQFELSTKLLILEVAAVLSLSHYDPPLSSLNVSITLAGQVLSPALLVLTKRS